MKRSMVVLLLLLAAPPVSAADPAYGVHVINSSEPVAISFVSPDVLRFSFKAAPAHRVALTDAPSSTAAALASFDGQSRQFDVKWPDAGLTPGRVYFLRFEPGTIVAKFRFLGRAWQEPQLSYRRLRESWQRAGRSWLLPYSGVKWNDRLSKWELADHWDSSRTASEAYYIEEGIRGPVNMGTVCQDRPLVDEISQFFLVYLQRFTTIGALRNEKSLTKDTSLLDQQGADAARTLP